MLVIAARPGAELGPPRRVTSRARHVDTGRSLSAGVPVSWVQQLALGVEALEPAGARLPVTMK